MGLRWPSKWRIPGFMGFTVVVREEMPSAMIANRRIFIGRCPRELDKIASVASEERNTCCTGRAGAHLRGQSSKTRKLIGIAPLPVIISMMSACKSQCYETPKFKRQCYLRTRQLQRAARTRAPQTITMAVLAPNIILDVPSSTQSSPIIARPIA
ncbi:hypothetical protein PHLCEN_2v6154 [Hermanssonia centrifuga]|uniref:Uncharacterized protein n=1 Tax=Hermanssonia centrifuga TaxID=98765 RepID=A0A2R6P0A6_9APHY|nr:hypothetical protein PHLCEN_2v6154 [Hermanssonia centrifuga]